MSDNIETPEGWERRGRFLFRQYGESFATIVKDNQEDWAVNVSLPDGGSNQDWYGSLDKAIAEANDQLGVPKPVEVVEREFDDGLLLWSDQTKRCARVEPFTGDWQHGIAGGWLFGGTTYKYKPEALEAARSYVRGDA